MTDEQKQKIMWAAELNDKHFPAHAYIEDARMATLRAIHLGLNARDEEVKVLREALNEASELVEALMMDNRGKAYKQAQDFMSARLQQFIDAHQALQHTSKKEG